MGLEQTGNRQFPLGHFPWFLVGHFPQDNFLIIYSYQRYNDFAAPRAKGGLRLCVGGSVYTKKSVLNRKFINSFHSLFI